MLTDLFLTILEISLSISIVIFVLLMISSRINKRFIAKWKYWIWLVIAVRLLFPFNLTLPQAPVQIAIPQSQVIFPPTPAPTSPAAPAKTIDVVPVLPVFPDTRPIQPVNTPIPETTAAESITLPQIAALFWLIGIIIFLLYHVSGYLVYKKRVLRWGYPNQQEHLNLIYQHLADELKIKKQITIMISESTHSPMMMGFLKPILLIPDIRYSETELYYILKHELIHYKRRDMWYKLVLLTANAFHWFNPFVYLMFREASKDLEISCDDEVLKTADYKDRKQYTEVILNSINEQVKRRHTVLSTDFDGGAKMLKERFFHILNTKRKRRGIWGFIILILCVVMVGFMVGCKDRPNPVVSTNSPEQIETEQQYVNQELGFALAIPPSWQDKFTAGPNPNNDKNIVQFSYNGGFVLFSIERIEGEHIQQEELPAIPPMKIVMQGNGFTYVSYMSGDVQVPVEKGEEAIREYRTMYGGVDELLKSIQPVGNEQPIAHTQGFKVIGTGYFKAEIPERWTIVRSDNDLSWSLMQGDEHVGEIRYEVWDGKTALVENEHTRYQSMIMDYTKASVDVIPSLVDQHTFKQIVASFEFRGGAHSVIEMQSNAARYVQMGAEKWFGMIKGFNMQDGEPVSVNIELMKFIPDTDATVNKNPNGFRIENLNEIRTVDVQPGCEVAPLIDNVSYGLYTTPNIGIWIDDQGQLASEYASSTDDFSNTYFDFIVQNGAVVQIFGHYIP
ncbi:M56 family metallopeptidase [Paenibacillus marinisediminis]